MVNMRYLMYPVAVDSLTKSCQDDERGRKIRGSLYPLEMHGLSCPKAKQEYDLFETSYTPIVDRSESETFKPYFTVESKVVSDSDLYTNNLRLMKQIRMHLSERKEYGGYKTSYIPSCSAANRIITAKDHASVHIGHIDEWHIYWISPLLPLAVWFVPRWFEDFSGSVRTAEALHGGSKYIQHLLLANGGIGYR
ncbi:hypothetical protein C5167_031043 [Papaver somniferum]|nr:hypothetical protein C5167_031043 [Papaver somniferum]